jgi:CRISPR/Cas system-associated exonuclease Cas4 (RecB family)
VILLSANEGIFPKTEAAVSYIPYNLRKGFGLPTIEHQDAIFAFYFYRLLQRAKDITITYNSQPSNRSGEMSRYLYQLKYENAFTLEERSVGFSISLSDEKEIIIPKSNEIVDYLQIFTPNTENYRLLTPTALSAYMECSLRFYFRYIAKIKEKEEITEDIEGSVFGKLLHFSMELLYKPYVGQVITENIFNSINNKETINQAIMQAFGTVYFKTGSDKEVLHGKSIIIKEILYKYVVEILQKDKRNIPFTIISLEENYKLVLDVDGISVNVGGVVDRIDQVNGAIRIIDYKTGSVEFSCPAIPVLFDREGDTGRYSAIFQSMLYALVVKSQSQFSSFPVYPGLYGLRKIFSNDFDCTISINKAKIENIEDYKTEYFKGLSEVLKEIFNTSVPFEKTRNPKKCENCSYRQICDR